MRLRILREPPEEPPRRKQLPDPRRDRKPATHRYGPDTEAKAANRMRPRAGSLRYRIIKRIRDGGPCTPDEACIDLGLYPVGLPGLRPRFTELRNDNWIYDTGRRNPTPGGGEAIVWDLTEDGYMDAKEFE